MSYGLPAGVTDHDIDVAAGYWEPSDESCDECGQTFGKTDATVAYRGKLLCVECVPTHCAKCGFVIYTNEKSVTDVEGDTYHEKCVEVRNV